MLDESTGDDYSVGGLGLPLAERGEVELAEAKRGALAAAADVGKEGYA